MKNLLAFIGALALIGIMFALSAAWWLIGVVLDAVS